jgi:hypothetical protein
MRKKRGMQDLYLHFRAGNSRHEDGEEEILIFDPFSVEILN